MPAQLSLIRTDTSVEEVSHHPLAPVSTRSALTSLQLPRSQPGLQKLPILQGCVQLRCERRKSSCQHNLKRKWTAWSSTSTNCESTFQVLTFDADDATRSDSTQDSIPRVFGSPHFFRNALCIDAIVRCILVSPGDLHSVSAEALLVRSSGFLTSTPAYVPPTAANSAACVPMTRPVLTRAGQA